MNGLDILLYESRDFFSVISAVVSVLAVLFEILTIIEAVKKRKENKSKVKSVVCIVVFLCVILFGALMFLRTNSLLEVPNVEGKLYKDAKAILIENGLEFNTIKGSEDKFVIGQTPEGGSIETEGTMVSLALEEIHVHVWKTTVIVEPTCISEGKREKRCDCGELEIEVVDEGDHRWEHATCTEPKKCSQCKKCEGTALGHDEVTVKGYAATCTTNGLTDGKECTVCGEVIEEQKAISAIGHDEVIVKGYVATCTAAGLTDGKKCSVCGAVTKEQKTINAYGHDEVTVKGYAATCTTAGLTDGKKCSVCGAVTKEQKTINAYGHDEVTVKGYAATCTATGLTDGKQCERCKVITMAQQIIPPIGHAYSNDTDLECNNCGYIRGYWSDYGAWSEWQDTSITENIYREVKDRDVVAAYNKKTQYQYSRYYGWNGNGSYWVALDFKSGYCQTYEETEWLDAPMEWCEVWSNKQNRNNDGYGYGIASDGTSAGKKIFWYNEKTREVDDLSSPIYKKQYRYRERYIIYY